MPERRFAPGNGQGGAPSVVLPVRRQRRAGLALAALLVALVSGLGFAVWARSLGNRHPVLAAAHTVQAGEVIHSDDLKVVRVAADGGVSTVPAGDKRQLVGKVAATPLFAGALVTGDEVSRSAPLGPNDAIVGVLVKPGQAPIADLRVGTTVEVVQTVGQSQLSGDQPQVLADSARIYAVAVPPGGDAAQASVAGAVLVSLKVPESESAAIVSAADADRIRLVVVAGVTQ
jgi:hypothetical protein